MIERMLRTMRADLRLPHGHFRHRTGWYLREVLASSMRGSGGHIGSIVRNDGACNDAHPSAFVRSLDKAPMRFRIIPNQRVWVRLHKAIRLAG